MRPLLPAPAFDVGGEQDRSFSLCHLPPIKEQHSG